MLKRNMILPKGPDPTSYHEHGPGVLVACKKGIRK